MSTQNTTAVVLDDTRESRLRERTDALLDEPAETLIREAECATETLVQPKRDERQPKPIYPSWPTSRPGPRAAWPPVDQKPVSTRTDQMTYECYDQELGMPCTPVPEAPVSRPHRQADQVRAGQDVYDTQGERVGKIVVPFPEYILVERGLIFHRSYYVPLWLVDRVEAQRVWLAVSEATLGKRGYGNVPSELYHVSRPSAATAFPDISGASRLGKYPPTPAETGHYHYGPLGPGINTDASGSYAPYEIDPYGRPVDRPVKLYSTVNPLKNRLSR